MKFENLIVSGIIRIFILGFNEGLKAGKYKKYENRNKHISRIPDNSEQRYKKTE